MPASPTVLRAAALTNAVRATRAALDGGATALHLEHAPTGDPRLDAAHAAAIHGFARSLRIEQPQGACITVGPPRFLVPAVAPSPRPRPSRPRCVITGAASGIGRAIALALADAGYTVLGVDHDPDAAGETDAALGDRGRIVVADLCGLDALPCTVEEPADLVIHNAGISQVGPFAAAAIDDAEAVIALNLDAPIRLTERLLVDGALAPDATIAFVSSLSHFVSYPGAAVYAGTKDGLAAYAEVLRSTHSRDVLGVLTIFPGPVRTAHARRYSPDNSGEHRRMDPALLADQILAALDAGQAHLVPGATNRAMAWLGRTAPSVAEALMDRALFRRLS